MPDDAEAHLPRILAVLGPTASGKSALAVDLAELLSQRMNVSAEIVGTDSMQAYRGLDIGTATPTTEERRGIAHHLVDAWDMSYPLTVAEFQAHARSAIDAIRVRGHVPIVVGGSGLYVSAVLDDLRFPGTDPAVRARLEDELARDGAAALHERLGALDPAAAEHVLTSNGRRIVRALEVIEITGQPFVATLPAPESVYPCVRVGLAIPRAELDERIEHRVLRMWHEGLVGEVRSLATQGLASAPTASRALGYAQALDFLAGACTEDEAIRRTVEATRRFARRQQRWFQRDDRIRWLDYDSPSLASDALLAWGSETDT
ncbi:MAG: tRNA (adenosine(37)-N6)-dimethylallyltransferase MiaA [Actinomycetota bacterium]|nr:tRNA (adenosine(37)-N6)-dimethylallyltransferase MiaA [Actinomycetota bacterium]